LGSQQQLFGERPLFLLFLAMRAHRWLLFLALLLSVACDLSLERDSLVALYNQTNGPSWINSTNWNSSVDPCAGPWFGVICDGNATVIGLSLPSNRLNGSLPDLQLPSLKQL
jgi:hypothetical protein